MRFTVAATGATISTSSYTGRMAVTDRPLRADAERNRQRILAAASQVFAERGLAVSLDDVAAAAGVGVGTVYRRFPDKDALIDALFEDKIRGVAERARAALEIDDPWEAFVAFMRGICASHAADRGLKEAMLSGDRGHERMRVARDHMAPVAAQVVGRAQAAGVLRPDIGVLEVPVLHMLIGDLAEKTREADPDYWERGLTIVLDGLRADRAAPTPLPGEPLDRDRFAAIMTRRRRC